MERGVRYLGQLLVLMAFFKVAAYTVNDNSTLMYFSTFVGRFDQFLIGMAAAMLVQDRRAQLQAHAPWLLAAAAALVVCTTGLMHTVAPFGGTPKSSFWIYWSMLESGAWACFIVAWVSFQRRLPAMLERVLCQGGKVSFSFYLLHMALLHILTVKVGLVHPTGVAWLDIAIMLVCSYGMTWVLSTLAYNSIEEPFLRMRRRYGVVNPAALASAV
jgi:peptidoglycan/LPS O-acetylase OafA/YrhL